MKIIVYRQRHCRFIFSFPSSLFKSHTLETEIHGPDPLSFYGAMVIMFTESLHLIRTKKTKTCCRPLKAHFD